MTTLERIRLKLADIAEDGLTPAQILCSSRTFGEIRESAKIQFLQNYDIEKLTVLTLYGIPVICSDFILNSPKQSCVVLGDVKRCYQTYYT